MIELALIVKATVVLGAALTATWVARGQRAAVRCSLLVSGFAVLLFLPLAAALSPRLEVEIPFAAEASLPGPAPSLPSSGPDIDSGMTPATPTGSATRTARGDDAAPLSWLELLRLAWALGVLLSLVPVVAVVRRLRHIRRHVRTWRDGDALARDVAAPGGLRRRVSVLLHEDVAVPMACGLMRPVVLMPADAPAWGEADLRRAFAHEIEHVRRADWPVFVAVRLLCAAWWFHPLAWTAWRRLCLEAERACDDAVLQSSDPRAYAAQLVRMADRLVARRPVPVPAMAGSGDLSERVKAVLSTSQRRGRAGRLWAGALAGVVLLALGTIAPLTLGAAGAAGAQDLAARTQTGERFEAVTLRQGTFPLNQAVYDVLPGTPVGMIHDPHGSGFAASGASAELLIRWAYGIGWPSRLRFSSGWNDPPRPFGVVEGAPGWDEVYDVRARTPRSYVAPPAGELGEVHEMVRTLLAERFQLQVHWESRDTRDYRLTMVDGLLGPYLRPAAPPELRNRIRPPDLGDARGAHFEARGETMEGFARALAMRLQRPVLDRTQLEGRFDITWLWNWDPDVRSPDEWIQSLDESLRDQLGLQLETEPTTEDVLVIDRIERPVLDP